MFIDAQMWHLNMWEPDPADESKVSHGFTPFYMFLLYILGVKLKGPAGPIFVSGGGAISVPIQMVREPLLGNPLCPLGLQCCLDMSE